jgi:hypothetical protein
LVGIFGELNDARYTGSNICNNSVIATLGSSSTLGIATIKSCPKILSTYSLRLFSDLKTIPFKIRKKLSFECQTSRSTSLKIFGIIESNYV